MGIYRQLPPGSNEFFGVFLAYWEVERTISDPHSYAIGGYTEEKFQTEHIGNGNGNLLIFTCYRDRV